MLNVSKVRIAEEFIEFYGRENLKKLVPETDERIWVKNFLRSPGRYFDPIKMILFHFYFETGTNLNDVRKDLNPFGVGPWECLNRASDHFNKNVVRDCVESLEPKSKRKIYTFSCDCGMTYTKSIVWDNGKSIVIRRTKEYGILWMNVLWKRLLAGVSFTLIAKDLGVSTATVHTFHNELNNAGSIGFSRSNKTPGLIKKRSMWIDLLTSGSLKHAKQANPELFQFLNTDDKSWLTIANTLIAKGKTSEQMSLPFQRSLNDSNILIEKILVDLKAQNYGGRITKRVITDILKNRNVSFHRNAKILSVSCRRLEETVDEYQSRKVTFAFEQLVKNIDPLFKWKLMRKAGFRKPGNQAVRVAEDLISRYK